VTPPAPDPARRITPAELFIGFAGIAMSGFGGVMPFARRMMVERRQWLTPAEFTDLVSLGQILPGPNIVNVSICVGWRFAGVAGIFAALAGLVFVPFWIVIGFGIIHATYGEVPRVQGAFAGIACAGAGLVIATGLKMAWPMLGNVQAMVFIALGFVAIAVLRWPLVPVVLVLAVLSIVVTAWMRSRR
jgi:chromate transporter